MELAEQLMADIADFKKKNKCSRLVMVWCGSTEVFIKEQPVHKTLASFEKGHARKSQGDCAFDDLRLRRDEIRSSVCQWRTELNRRHSGVDRI